MHCFNRNWQPCQKRKEVSYHWPYLPYIALLSYILSSPYVSLYFPHFALYALCFQQFHQINRLNPKEGTTIPWFSWTCFDLIWLAGLFVYLFFLLYFFPLENLI